LYMKTITVKEMKAHWKQIESQVKAGEVFEVLNRGKVAAHIVPAKPRQVLQWPDHLATAYKNSGKPGSEVIREQREGRF
jgi:antitoxin (DNA-binding transcriptional repressor) of toxin-antitoxin stability system